MNTQRLYRIASTAEEKARNVSNLLARSAIEGQKPSLRVYEYNRDTLATDLALLLVELVETEGARIPQTVLDSLSLVW